MLGDLLLRIEKLHEFIDDCVTNDSLSLIDKDIILQNMRDIYIVASKMNIDGSDVDFDDDFENENIILFDSKEPLKHIETIDENSIESEENSIESEEDVEMEAVQVCDTEDDMENEQHDYVEVEQIEIQPEDEKPEELLVENSTAEEELVVYDSEEDSDLELSITSDERLLILRELCAMNEDKYYELINKLNSFTDLDEVLIYISEEFSASQNSESAVLLADKMAERLEAVLIY